MKKTKIVFVTQRMMMGGIEKALISMLEQIPKDKFEITLLVVHSGGELYNQIPKHVKVKHVFDKELRISKKTWRNFRQGKLITVLKIILNALLLKHSNNSTLISKLNGYIYYSRLRQMEEEQYDVAISYSDDLSLPIVYVPKNIQARRKWLWIHSDLEELSIRKHEVLVKKLETYYGLFDNIFCVSNHSLKKFIKVFPKLSAKASVFYNILNHKEMNKLSNENESFKDNFSGMKILTVGRLSKEKGQEIIPKLLSKLLNDGYNLRWYCIGDGPTLGKIKKTIKEYNLEKHLILLGIKRNPFPYFKDCDLYVQPSKEEAYGITIAEAKAFHKPIITTNTGASEQIIHEETGIVVAFDELEMYEAIKRLIDNRLLRAKLIKNLTKENIDTTLEMDKFCSLIKRTI